MNFLVLITFHLLEMMLSFSYQCLCLIYFPSLIAMVKISKTYCETQPGVSRWASGDPRILPNYMQYYGYFLEIPYFCEILKSLYNSPNLIPLL